MSIDKHNLIIHYIGNPRTMFNVEYCKTYCVSHIFLQNDKVCT